jgi:hypothetical protein
MVSKRERALETHQFLPINANLLGPESLSLSFGRPGQGLLQRRQEPFSGRIPERTRPAERPRVDNCHLPSTRPAPRCHGRCGFPRSNNDSVKFSGHAKRLSLAQDSKPLPRLCERATRFLLGGLVRLQGIARIRRGLHKRPCWFLHRRRSPALVSFRTAPLLLNWNFRFDLCLAHCMLLLP